MKWLIVLLLLLGIGAFGYAALRYMTRMPGDGGGEPARPAPEREGIEERLRASVTHLAETLGERNVRTPEALSAAAEWIEERFRALGLEVERHCYEVSGVTCCNLEARIDGRDPALPVLVVGAHYDSVRGSPGANDNASGVAGLLELAAALAGREPPLRTVRLVAFVNEEPPWFQTEEMGSLRYAERCRERGDRIRAMISLESIGCFLDEPGSQEYPPVVRRLYPDRGDFIAFVGDLRSSKLMRRSIERFREVARIPSEGGALPADVPGVDWSDHWAFWQQGYEAFMVTDTAVFRDATYHTVDDLPGHLDYGRMSRVVEGVVEVVRALADEPQDEVEKPGTSPEPPR